MSMFDRYSDNDINLRLNEIILNELYIKNPETNNYDRFIPGSLVHLENCRIMNLIKSN
jgi:hypothetical protein